MKYRHDIVKEASIKLLLEHEPSDLEILLSLSKCPTEYQDFISDVLFGEITDDWILAIGSADMNVLADIGVMCYAIRYLVRRGQSVAWELTKVADLGKYKPRFDAIMKRISNNVDEEDIPTTDELNLWFES